MKCVSYRKLAEIPTDDNSEPLVDLRNPSFAIRCAPQNEKMVPYVGQAMLVRQGVAERLVRAQSALSLIDSKLFLKVLYAYRHPEIQQLYFEKYLERVRHENPKSSEEELLELTHHFIAVTEVAGHPTGGAIDISVEQGDTWLTMGGRPGNFEQVEKFPVYSPLITEEQLKNRLLLRSVLTNEGFAPYDLEWWHFSYGDREWAAFYGLKVAHYGAMHLNL